MLNDTPKNHNYGPVLQVRISPTGAAYVFRSICDRLHLCQVDLTIAKAVITEAVTNGDCVGSYTDDDGMWIFERSDYAFLTVDYSEIVCTASADSANDARLAAGACDVCRPRPRSLWTAEQLEADEKGLY